MSNGNANLRYAAPTIRTTDRFIMDCHKDTLRQSLLADQLQRAITSADQHLPSKVARMTAPVTAQASLEDLYTSRLLQQRQHLIGSSSPVRTVRVVPRQPERVLDAPGICDDFYLNVLDWSVRNIVAVALGNSVYLWSGADGSVRELTSLPEAEETYCSSLAWIHDGRSIAIGCSDGQVQIWDVERSRKLRTMIVSPQARVSALSWNRHLLSTGSRNGAVLTHDVRVARHLSAAHQTSGSFEVCGLAWSPDGQQLASGANDNLVHLWERTAPDASQNKLILEGHRSAVKAIAWCPWKPQLLATGGGSADRHIRLWDTTSGECLENVDTGSQISSLIWSRHGHELLSSHGYERNHLALWTVSEGGRQLCQAAEIEHAHESRILHMRLSPDGCTVATAAADESIKFWPLFNRRPATEDKNGKDSAAWGVDRTRSALFPSLGDGGHQDTSTSPFSLRTKALR